MAEKDKKAGAKVPEKAAEPKKKKGGIFIKIIIMGVILLVLAGGALVVLARYQIVNVPYVSDLPFIAQEKTSTSSTPQLTELQKAAQENDKLKKTIQDQTVEIEALNQDLNKLKLDNQAAIKKQTENEKTILDLQNQIIALKGGKSSEKAAYKQMATYFTEMKAADAANIIVNLDDKDIIGILSEMDADVAAGILGKFPNAKATAITKKMLVTSP